VVIKRNLPRNIPKTSEPKNANANKEKKNTPTSKKLSTLTLVVLKKIKTLWKNVPISNTTSTSKYLCYGISLMSFLMTIKEYRGYLTSGISTSNAFCSNGTFTEEMRPQFREYQANMKIYY
jgi:hypothetical protein